MSNRRKHIEQQFMTRFDFSLSFACKSRCVCRAHRDVFICLTLDVLLSALSCESHYVATLYLPLARLSLPQAVGLINKHCRGSDTIILFSPWRITGEWSPCRPWYRHLSVQADQAPPVASVTWRCLMSATTYSTINVSMHFFNDMYLHNLTGCEQFVCLMFTVLFSLPSVVNVSRVFTYFSVPFSHELVMSLDFPPTAFCCWFCCCCWIISIFAALLLQRLPSLEEQG